MKSVVYLTCTKLPCVGTSQANVVICIKDTIELVSGLNNLPAFLLVSTEIHDDCNACVSYWRYTLSYDENLLVDPEVLLTSDDITGLFCKTCFTDWIESFSGGLPIMAFKTIDVPSGTNPVAASVTDTLNLIAGPNVTITGDETTQEVTFALTGVALLAFSTIDCLVGSHSPGGTIVADSASDTLTMAGDGNVSLQAVDVLGFDAIFYGLNISQNNVYLISRNAANSSNMNVLKVDASDHTVLNAATGKSILFTENSVTQWEIQSDGDFVGDATNGGNLIISATNKGVVVGAAALHADESVFGNADLYARADSSARPHMLMTGIGAVQTGPIVYGVKTRATDGSADVIVAASDQMYNLSCWAADGAAYRSAGSITVTVETGSTPASNDIASAISFFVRPAGVAAAPAEALTIRSNRWLEVKNTAAAPGTNPSGGGYLYVEAGALKFRGSSGTVTVIAPA